MVGALALKKSQLRIRKNIAGNVYFMFVRNWGMQGRASDGVQVAERAFDDEAVLKVAAVIDSEFGYKGPLLVSSGML